MINSTQNTNFGARITVSSKVFKVRNYLDLEKAGKVVDAPYTIRQAKFLKDEGMSLGAAVCTMGFLKPKEGDEFFLFHFIPTCWKKDIKEGLLQAQERLKKQCQDLEGFIIGADANDADGMDKANFIVDIFKETGVKFSALIGQKDYLSAADLHYSLPKDEATIDFRNANTAVNVRDLGRFFSTVIIGEDRFSLRDDVI